MGVDWFRFKLKDNTNTSLVTELIAKQAISYQSLWGWDSKVRGNWKVKCYEERYYLSFAEFKDSFFNDDWLETFFDWVNQCCNYGFGLYLDY